MSRGLGGSALCRMLHKPKMLQSTVRGLPSLGGLRTYPVNVSFDTRQRDQDHNENINCHYAGRGMVRMSDSYGNSPDCYTAKTSRAWRCAKGSVKAAIIGIFSFTNPIRQVAQRVNSEAIAVVRTERRLVSENWSERNQCMYYLGTCCTAVHDSTDSILPRRRGRADGVEIRSDSQ
jgi:hypothetical protein